MNASADWTDKLGSAFKSDSDDKDADKGYRAWRKSKKSFSGYLRICPVKGSGEKTHFIAYLQNIDAELDEESKQLCLICNGSDKIIFIEGEGLEEIAIAVTEKRAVSLHVYDPRQGVSKESCFISKITVEDRRDIRQMT